MKNDKIKFDENGLIPAIVQDIRTGRVLMMAYMNRESMDITIKEGRTCFYSRSRQTLWRKGETSGNVQRVVSIETDCDGDTLLVRVEKDGPACHTGSESCFDDRVVFGEFSQDFKLESLYQLIEGRRISPKEGSYTSYLFEKGLDKILKKVGEESTEVVVAAKNSDNEELCMELADLCYHSLVLMAHQGLTIEDIREELAKRHVVDKKVKQETKKS